MEKKKKTGKERKEIQLVPAEATYLNQPNLVTYVKGNFTVVQWRAFSTMIKSLQKHISENIGLGYYRDINLFTSTSEGTIDISIPLKEFKVEPKRYLDLYKSLKDLQTTVVEFNRRDPIENKEYLTSVGLISRLDFPLERYVTGDVKITLDKSIAKCLVYSFFSDEEYSLPEKSKGYTNFIYEIAFMTNNKYTQRIYQLISANKHRKYFEIEIQKLREMLGIKKDEYLRFNSFVSRMLKKPQTELEMIGADVLFNYEVIKNKDKEPEKIKFEVYYNENFEDGNEKSKLETYRDFLVKQLRSKHYLKEEQIEIVLSKIKDTYVAEEIWKTIKRCDHFIFKKMYGTKEVSNIEAYVWKSLNNLFEKLKI